MTNYTKLFEKDYGELLIKYNKMDTEYKELKYEYMLLQKQLKTKDAQIRKIEEETKEKMKNISDKTIQEKDNTIEGLNKEVERLKGLLCTDGTNSGLPTSKTPINKQKVVPNSREKSNKKKGGQKGHKKHKLEKIKDEDINDNVYHKLDKCPECGGKLTEIDEICKDETSFIFVPVFRRHHFLKYKCNSCNKEVHQPIPNRLKEDNQYGSEIQAIALSLANEGNVPMNKIRRIIRGFTQNTIDLSEGYIAKLQKRASEKLAKFKNDLYKLLIKESQLYWDDTVIMVNQNRSCLRFYGNEKIAYYTAHEKKNKDGIIEDGILNTISKYTKVMHDHNKINYQFDYINQECDVHLLRDLQKCTDNAHHEWSGKFKKLVDKAIHDRKEWIEQGKDGFDENYLNEFDNQYNDILLEGIEENLREPKTHYDKEEKALIIRILDYKANYFIWMLYFNLPVDDNLSESSLRSVKSKMKNAGQFQNINYAKYYADIKTYIETVYRNGINPTDALIRLMEDNPYTVEEIFAKEKD